MIEAYLLVILVLLVISFWGYRICNRQDELAQIMSLLHTALSNEHSSLHTALKDWISKVGETHSQDIDSMIIVLRDHSEELLRKAKN